MAYSHAAARAARSALRAAPSAPQLTSSGSSSGLGRRRAGSCTKIVGDALTAVQWQALRYQRCIAASCATQAIAAPPAAAPAAPDAAALITSVDIRVGKILKCERHPEADSLYVSQIECGEAEPRTIVSGLVKFVPIEAMQDRKVVIIANLKPRNLKGVKSNGMVLCASDAAHENVEPLVPPADAAVGERVWFGEGQEKQPAPAEPNRVQKKKMWETVQPELKTDGNCVAGFKGLPMLTSSGPVKSPSLAGASIS